jgi:hypothetical protein
MKKIIISCFLFASMGSCVQKAYEQEVTCVLDVSKIKEKIETVGIRGDGKPLSWDKDLEMKPIKKDSLYAVTVKAKTGYKFAEFKFVVNGKFEFENEDNRRVDFDEDRTTTYNAVFNVR